MNELVKRCLNSMVFLLLKYPLQDKDLLDEDNYTGMVYDELQVMLPYFDAVVCNTEDESNQDTIKALTDIIGEEFAQGSYFCRMTPEEYFEDLGEFIQECTGKNNTLEFIRKVYDECLKQAAEEDKIKELEEFDNQLQNSHCSQIQNHCSQRFRKKSSDTELHMCIECNISSKCDIRPDYSNNLILEYCPNFL